MSFVKYGTIIGFTQVTELPTTIGGYGITDAVPSARTLTINGTTFDLSANRTFTVGSVTSVALSVPTGLTISGSPITSSGTLAITLTSGYSIPTTASQTNWDTAYTNRITSLTTTGTSGAATLIGNVLNIPQYAGGGGGGTVTSVASGNGMNFTTITSSGSVTLGTPSSTTLSSTNAVTATSHTHAFAPGGTVSQYISGAGTLITFPTLTNGTVTSVAALTLGTTGTDLSSSVANGTTTPVITLNVPNASATNRGALTSTDWSTFNSKQAALSGTGFVKISGTTISYDNSTYYLASNPNGYTTNVGTVTSVGLSSATSGVTIGSTPITTSGTITLTIATASGSQQGLLSSTDWTTFNSKQNALTNPVTGTGTINYIPKFTATGSTIGNSDLRTDSNNNLGLGVTPSAWGTGYLALQLSGQGESIFANKTISALGIASNGYYNGTNWIYNNSDLAGQYQIVGNSHQWYIAPTGTAGNTITFTQAMTLTANNRLLINQTSDTGEQLQVNGTGKFGSSVTANRFIASTIISLPVIEGTGNDPSNAQVRIINNNGNSYSLISGITGITNYGFTIRNNTGGADMLTFVNTTNAATFSGTLQAAGEITTGSVSRAFIRQTVGGDAELGCKSGGVTSIWSDGATRLSFGVGGAATFSSSVTTSSYVRAANTDLAGSVYTLGATFNGEYMNILGGGVAAQTYTLYTPTGNNRVYVVMNQNTVTNTISAGSGNTITVGTTQVSSVTIASGARAMFWSDGNVRFYQIF